MKRKMIVLPAVVLVMAAWWQLTPSLDAQAWQPAEPPAWEGVLTPDESLKNAVLLAKGEVHGPEDIAMDAQGRLHTGLHDGRIIRVEKDGRIVTLTNTGGRPLGMVFDAAGNLVVCDAWKGLIKLTPSGELITLVTQVDGVPLRFTDDLDIAADGKIYFTDASTKYTQPDYVLDLLEGRPYGRLYVHDPADGSTRLLLDGLYFANGVALSQNGDAVFVAETYRYRIRKLWLTGERAGQNDIIADNLPGLPDNINSDGKGTIWLAMPSPRKAIADVSAKYPWMRKVMVKLPRALWPKPDRYGLAVAMNENGKLLHSLHDTTGDHLRMVTSVLPHGGKLYVGSLENDRIGVLSAP
ncbi:MAG: SMP-30/gluconolactonase/LRE family protein [Moraxellaceae bacterium]|nr:SMP-30/gluconolactonase/LRE family protein [Moraxellaceae bacterium]